MENIIFNIYHPLDGVINHECSKHEVMYDFVAFVEASSLNEAFQLGQNDFNSEYAKLEKRSTCVGDIITTPKDSVYEGKHYMVIGRGFEEIPESVLAYVNKEIQFQVFQSWSQMVLENPEDFGLV